jgi:hypothetical protein
MRELVMILFSRGDFGHSIDELAPTKDDPMILLVLLGQFLVLVVHDSSGAEKMITVAVSKYALSLEGWKKVLIRNKLLSVYRRP